MHFSLYALLKNLLHKKKPAEQGVYLPKQPKNEHFDDAQERVVAMLETNEAQQLQRSDNHQVLRNKIRLM